MTNPVMEEIYSLADQALRQGQERFQVHVFPFRMTEDNLRANAKPVWQAFWLNLKEAYDIFERTHVPPSIGVCQKRYVVSEAAPAASNGQPSDPRPVPKARFSRSCRRRFERPGVKVRHRGRKVASKTRGRRMAGRNARKTYAAVRRAHSRGACAPRRQPVPSASIERTAALTVATPCCCRPHADCGSGSLAPVRSI